MLFWLQRQVRRWRARIGERRALAGADGRLLSEVGLSRIAITAVLAGAAIPMSRQIFD